MSRHSSLVPHVRFRSLRTVTALLALLFVLAWSKPALCDEIHDTAAAGDLEKVKALLGQNPALVFSKAEKYSGGTPLHLAAGFGHKEVVQLLLDFKAEVDAKNKNGYTPLYVAARSGQKDVVELLLAHGADINAKDNNGQTPLDAVLSEISNHRMPDRLRGQEEVVELLRQHGGQAVSAHSQPAPSAPRTSGQIPDSASTSDAEKVRSVPSIVIRGGKTFLAGEVSIGGDISTIETILFTCNPVQSLKKGDKVLAMVSDDQAWSADKRIMQVGANKIAYPILAMVKSGQSFVVIFPGLLKAKTDIKVGETVRSDGYQVETKRAVNAGDSISVLFVGESLLSVEAAERTKDNSDAKPWFTAYRDGMESNARSSAIEAWRIAGRYAARSGSAPPIPSSEVRGVADQDDSEKVQAQLLRDNGGQLTASPPPQPNADGTSGERQHGDQRASAQTQTSPAAPNGGGQNPDTTRTLDLAKVKALIVQDPNQVFIRDKNGRTPLHYAAAGGSRELAELLLANHADVNPTDNDGWTPLHIAVLNDRKDVAELLLANHANVNAPKGPKAGGLPTGVPMSMADVLIATMEARVDEGATPLHVASRQGYKDLVELLLANKAEVNAKENDGTTALHTAAAASHKDVVELLLAHNADINAKDERGNTPLHMTAEQDHKEMAELLLAHGADVNAKDSDGRTPLHLAAMYGHKDVAEVLLANKADLNGKDNRGRTPLYLAAHKFYKNSTSKEKQKLVEQGQKDVAELLRLRGSHE